MKVQKIAAASVIAVCLAAGTVSAEEQKLKFRLVTTDISRTSLDAPNVTGHAVGAIKAAGVAVFEDGRIAFKDFVYSMNSGGKEGSYSGYSVYTFMNGDSLTLKFDGGWSSEGNGGDYEVVSGTGAFQGATGTGRFDAKKDPWESATLWDGSMTVKLAGN